MLANYIEHFASAAFDVLGCLGQPPTRIDIAAQTDQPPSQDVNVFTGVAGMVEGQVIYGLSRATAVAVAAAMIGAQVAELDPLAASAIAELGNMITGNAATNLANAGRVCHITPPTVVLGNQVQFSTPAIQPVVVLIGTPHGPIHMCVSLRERK